MAKYNTLVVKNGGLEMEVMNYGGIIAKLLAPDSAGKMGDIVLGCKTPAEYAKQKFYLGALVGRCCSRISGAKFSLDGEKFKLDANNGKNTLHGGSDAFSNAIWDMTPCTGAGWKGVCLHYLSPDMQSGFPGNLDVTVYYKLTDNAELVIEYAAHTDRPTVCNLTNHTYFDLSAGKAEDILDHRIKINSAFYTPAGLDLVATGEVLSVAGTVLDLRKFRKIRDGVEAESQLIVDAHGGYDHNYVLPNPDGSLVQAAVVYDPLSGRGMEVLTTEPGVQFYTGNFIENLKDKSGKKRGPHSGFCLETQHWPDAPNKAHFPSVALYPGELYESMTVYRFSK